jgi:multidrug efflux pump subunit AcrB
MKQAQYSGPIAWFAGNPVAANLLMVLILLTGIVTAAGLRTEGFPSLAPKSITISVAYDSGSALQAEEGIAIKIEEALQGLSGIKKISSTADGSGATVTVEKENKAQLDQLLTDVKTRVDAIYSFPARAEKPVISKEEWNDHAVWITLYGETDNNTLQKLVSAC